MLGTIKGKRKKKIRILNKSASIMKLSIKRDQREKKWDGHNFYNVHFVFSLFFTSFD